MKKIIITVMILFAGCTLHAQGGDTYQTYINMEIVRICASIFAVGLFMLFILNILKRVFEHRLKNKIVDKGISENMASSVLKSTSEEDKNINIKWFAILAGIGMGLTITYYTLPLGIHSLAIMAFSVSLSFLGYFLFLRQAGKK